jgi:hypothetical protein
MAGAGAWTRPKWYDKNTVGPTVASAIDDEDRRRIRYGAKAVEIELKIQGYLPSTVIPDGIFYDKTDAAIRAFQRDHKLDPDGAAGPLTAFQLWRPVVIWEEEAGRIKIPNHYAHGIFKLESNYDPAAEGVATENGIDRGIGQLNSKVYPDITAAMAYSNPRMGIAISVSRLREARRRQSDELSYADRGAWDCAILDHNWPVAADYLYDTGDWLLTEEEKENGVAPENGRAAKYVRRVKERAAAFV